MLFNSRCKNNSWTNYGEFHAGLIWLRAVARQPPRVQVKLQVRQVTDIAYN